MKLFGALPVKLKLIILLLFISFATLVISSAFFIYNDLRGFKENLLKNLTVLAGTVGASSRAAIYFNDQERATEILSSLKEDSQIQYAAIYNSKGDIFVTYENGDISLQKPQVKKDTFHIIKNGIIELKQPIFLKDKRIGEIYLSADLREYNIYVNNYLFMVGMILFSTFGVAIILSFVLQKFLSKPIQTLAKTVKAISNSSDYSIRVDYQNKDEIGDLYYGFNQMISQIEKREIELTVKNSFLKKEIEQRNRAEDSLKTYAKELKRSNQELQEFAAIASHDLQEPLRKIITFGDRIAKEFPETNERGNDYIERMQKASERMKKFINDLLEYSKIESKANPFKREDLNNIFSDAMESLEFQITESQAQISCDSLPTLEVDSFQIHQLFQNLIGNAIKYKKENDPPVIQINACSIGNGLWEIVVKDNGIGIDSEYLERIFKPFERLHGKNEYEGSGMGLTICRKIANRHGGNISASSVPQKGSTFRITLPEIQKREKESSIFPSEKCLENMTGFDT